MRFLVHRASRNPIGDGITLLDKTEVEDIGEYGIFEISDLSQLPKEPFLIRYHTDTWDEEALNNMGLSESYIDGTITLYDDYIE